MGAALIPAPDAPLGAGFPVRQETRLDRLLAFGRRPARVSRIEGLAVPPQMIEYPLDDGGVLDARNDPEPAATAPAPFNLDRQDPLEALGLRLIARCRAPAVLSLAQDQRRIAAFRWWARKVNRQKWLPARTTITGFRTCSRNRYHVKPG